MKKYIEETVRFKVVSRTQSREGPNDSGECWDETYLVQVSPLFDSWAEADQWFWAQQDGKGSRDKDYWHIVEDMERRDVTTSVLRLLAGQSQT